MVTAEERRTEYVQAWEDMLTDQQNSGKSIRDWCKDNELSVSTFMTRKRKLGKTENAVATPFSPDLKFAKVELAPSVSSDVVIKVKDIEICINSSASLELVSSILQVALHAQ